MTWGSPKWTTLDPDYKKWKMGPKGATTKEGAGKEVKTGQPPLKVKACLLITDHIVTFFIIINSIAILTIILILIILQNHPQTSRRHYSDWGDSGQYIREKSSLPKNTKKYEYIDKSNDKDEVKDKVINPHKHTDGGERCQPIGDLLIFKQGSVTWTGICDLKSHNNIWSGG